MTYPPDPRIEEAKGQDIEALCDRLGLAGLKRRSCELAGPCPNCGGTNRFNVNLRSGLFLCRQCDVRGGDAIALVMQVMSLSFPDALTWICGAAPADEVERARREARARADRGKRDAESDRHRAAAIAAARRIWAQGRPATGTPVQYYLERRGLSRRWLPMLPGALRYHPGLKYMEHSAARKEWVEVHRGPAMLAKMVLPDGSFGGVHRTWIDLDRPGGKIAIPREGEFAGKVAGETFDAKKTLGAKRGGTIRLAVDPAASTMVVGEGIETTLTALVAGVFPAATFLCAIDLGNMAGQRLPVPTKSGGQSKRFSDLPDMDDDRAFVPPAWVRRLVFIQDGDSEPRFTRACLTAGLRRAMRLRPGIECQIWPAPVGKDLNDLLEAE